MKQWDNYSGSSFLPFLLINTKLHLRKKQFEDRNNVSVYLCVCNVAMTAWCVIENTLEVHTLLAYDTYPDPPGTHSHTHTHATHIFSELSWSHNSTQNTSASYATDSWSMTDSRGKPGVYGHFFTHCIQTHTHTHTHTHKHTQTQTYTWGHCENAPQDMHVGMTVPLFLI